MEPARLMNLDSDYERLGISRGPVEMWEDGKRDDDRKGVVEWWYFDCILDDGSKIAAVYSTKIQPFTGQEGTHPCLKFDITTPEGEKVSKRAAKFPKGSVSFSKEKCEVIWGENCFVGDLKNYHIKAVPIDGYGFDVTLESQSSPWRGETGYLGFGPNDEKYFTWLCVVPRGKVTGTLTIDGVAHEVTGSGYHDHQWGNTIQFEFLNHWLWARQSTEHYTMATFDFILNEGYGYKRIPFVFLEDLDGNLLFSSTDNVECTVEEELYQEACETNFPKVTHYVFRQGAKTIDYTITVKDELDGRSVYKSVPFFMRGMFNGTKPKYGRYLADGRICFTDGEHPEKSFTENSDFIYEFAYVGDEYKKYAEIPLVAEE